MSRRKRRRGRSKRLPRLRPEHLRDPDQFALVVDEAVMMMSRYRRLRRQIVELEEQLRELVDDDAWQVFLALEAILNQRYADAIDHVAEWAFREGQRDR